MTTKEQVQKAHDDYDNRQGYAYTDALEAGLDGDSAERFAHVYALASMHPDAAKLIGERTDTKKFASYYAAVMRGVGFNVSTGKFVAQWLGRRGTFVNLLHR